MTISTGLPPVSEPAAEARTTPLEPRLLIPSLTRGGSARPEDWTCADLAQFPDLQFINERHRRGEAACHSPAFRECIRGATEQVFIVDKYLLQSGDRAVDEVLSWFPENCEAKLVRIACDGVVNENELKNPERAANVERRVKTRFEDRKNEINRRRDATGKARIELALKFTFSSKPAPHVHDRFAIIDDELWHWGATVGGLHPGVSAASRGWSVGETKAAKFFSDVWNQRDNRRGRRG